MTPMMMMIRTTVVMRVVRVVEGLPTAPGQRDQIMAGSSTNTLQLGSRLGTSVTAAILELEWSHVPANRMENGSQSCRLVNVRTDN